MVKPVPMMKPAWMAASFVLSVFSLSAQATLTSYTVNSTDLVYSSVSNVTWTKDAHLLGTLFSQSPLASAVLIPKIIEASARQGLAVTSADFNLIGQTSWRGGRAFIHYLNSINYGGSNQWYLPSIDNQTAGFNIATNGIDQGGEQVELFYRELNGTAGGAIPNTSTFDNEKAGIYWSGTASDLGAAWVFSNAVGAQLRQAATIKSYVWAVTAGNLAASAVSPVPEPKSAAMWLLGLMGVVAAQRKREA